MRSWFDHVTKHEKKIFQPQSGEKRRNSDFNTTTLFARSPASRRDQTRSYHHHHQRVVGISPASIRTGKPYILIWRAEAKKIESRSIALNLR